MYSKKLCIFVSIISSEVSLSRLLKGVDSVTRACTVCLCALLIHICAVAFDARLVCTYRQMRTHTPFRLSTTTQLCSDLCLSYSYPPRYCQTRSLKGRACSGSSRQTTIVCHRTYVQTYAHACTFQILYNIAALF